MDRIRFGIPKEIDGETVIYVTGSSVKPQVKEAAVVKKYKTLNRGMEQ